MPTDEELELEHQMIHEIEDMNAPQDALVRAWFSYQNDPSSVDDATLFDVIRWRRDGLLLSCDWTQIADCTADKSAWAEYRQQLRDLPMQNVNPQLIVFPTPPV